MSDEDLMRSTDALLEYLKGDRDTIDLEAEIDGVTTQVFTTRESLHMEDVKDLYDGAMLARNICAVITVIGGIVLFIKEKKNRYAAYLDGLENGLFMMGTFVFCIGAWALLDFSDFWMDFHYLFFDNDLFLLDSSSSVMINMFPESFFFDLVFVILIVFVLCCAGIYILLRRMHRKENVQ